MREGSLNSQEKSKDPGAKPTGTWGTRVRNGLRDLKYPDIFDVPVMEGLLGVITLFGAFLVVRGVTTRPYLKKRFLLVVGFFAALAYGGWTWSEGPASI